MDHFASTIPTIQDALAVIYTFNNTTNQVERESANQWLAAFQKSFYAWTISDQILRMGSDLNACFFAAQTMRTKLQYSFHELPVDTYVSLKDSLLEHASHLTAHSPAAITSQLCVAIAHMYFQMTAWTAEAMTELFTRFGNNKQHWYMLVELLQTIAEELNSRHLSVGDPRKHELTRDLSRYSSTMVDFLVACLRELHTMSACSSAPSESEFARLNATHVDMATRMQVRVYLSLGSSLVAHVLNEADLLGANGQFMFDSAFSFLAAFGEVDDSMLHDAVTECICSAMIACEDVAQYGRLGDRLHGCVLALDEAYRRAVALQQLEAACNICRVWTETAETFIEHLFVSSPTFDAFSHALLQQLLLCVGHTSYQLAEITLPFWSRLLERLCRLTAQANHDESGPSRSPSTSRPSLTGQTLNDDAFDTEDGVTTEQQAAAIVQLYDPLLRSLLIAVMRHCELDKAAESGEDEAEFDDFRARAADLVQDIATVLGSSNCVSLIDGLLIVAPSWQFGEACFFALKFVVACADVERMQAHQLEPVTNLLDYVLRVPIGDDRTPLALSKTCLALVGELARCLGVYCARHSAATSGGDAPRGEDTLRSSNLLERALSLLFTTLRLPPLGAHAAHALALVCIDCRTVLVSHFDTLLEIFMQCDSFALSNDASLELTKCFALTLAELPADAAHTRSDQLVTVLSHVTRSELEKVLRLASALNGQVRELPSTDREKHRPHDFCVHLDRIGVFFRYLSFPHDATTCQSELGAGDTQHPVAVVALEIWPDLALVLEHFKTNNRVSERCCRCLRFMLRSAHRSMIVLLDPMIATVTRLYAETGHTCFLYLASVIIDEFGANEALQQKLTEMTIQLTGPTMQLFTDNPSHMVSQPDAVEDFFRLATRSFQRMPRAFVETDPLVTSTLLCAVPAIRIQHKDAHFAVKRFLSEFIDSLEIMQRSDAPPPPRHCTTMNEKFMLIGSQLVNNALFACLFDLPSHMIAESAELLHTILLYNQKAFSEWVELALKQLTASESTLRTFRVTDAEINAFFRDLVSAKKRKQVKGRVKQFARLFRR